jgi:Putative ABC exporter
MHRTLLLLSKLRLLGQWRKAKRSLASPLGILLALFFVGFVAMLVVPRLLFPSVPGGTLAPVTELIFHPAMLFLLWISTLIGSRLKSPIAFSMAEVDFLFSGPFTRRQLLIHKLLVSTLGPLGFAVMAPLVFPFVWWPAAILGVLLIATFLQWWTILLALAVDWIGARYRVLRWALFLLALAAVAASIWRSGALAADLDYRARLSALESSWAAQIVLAPFAVFSRAISAGTLAAMLSWGAGALAMLLAVAVAILKLDGYFFEASLEASRRRYESIERLKRSGGAAAFRMRSRPRFTLPRLPRLLGTGPIAWRQGLEVVRRSGGPIVVVAVPAAIGLGVASVIVAVGHGHAPLAGFIVGVTLFVGFSLNMMPMGLRADLDHLEVMKTLPIGPYWIVLGSVVFAILYVTFLQLITVICMAAVLGEWFPAVPLALAVALPINVLSLAFDGVMVLLFPSIRRFVPGDPLVGARIMFTSLAKIAFALASVMLAALPFGVAWLLGSRSLAVPIAAGYCMLMVEGLATVALAALLFDRFDASTHIADDD